MTPANLSLNFTSYTPTLTNITLGNGTLAASYLQIGNLVCYDVSITMGSSSSVGNGATFSLPVSSSLTQRTPVGSVTFYHTSTTLSYPGYVLFNTGSTGLLVGYLISNTLTPNQPTTSTFPFTVASGDTFTISGVYPAT